MNPPPLSPLSRHYDLSANALKNIVHSIVFGSASSKVPYQDSKVTMLLREYLGGFGRTSVLTHLSPNTQNLTTSIESIKMAKLLSQIENSPHCHPDPTQMTILRRLDELAAARERLLVIEEEKQRVSEIY